MPSHSASLDVAAAEVIFADGFEDCTALGTADRAADDAGELDRLRILREFTLLDGSFPLLACLTIQARRQNVDDEQLRYTQQLLLVVPCKIPLMWMSMIRRWFSYRSSRISHACA
ncbi:uncharacterized protein LOC119766032 [Culex quinquefasciatus]|uniref:uncharacterized protein LOC119766032 n=1 Tax=Culex quinquefasciatus TaxID=7176 RepID=UPI0018E3068C|nr:uncharacterized protein LOC119766032 [Culex quinquefasciatus]